jgi:2'-5' RNA ligase
VPCAIALALDAASASVVRAVWQALAEAGFPFLAESGAAPHVSLAIWDEIDLVPMVRALATFAAETSRVSIEFSRVDVFASTGAVFLAPRADAALPVVHARCHERLAVHGRRPWAHYAPGTWVPHCTLAQDIHDADALARARTVTGRIALPLTGWLDRAELIAFHPVRALAAYPLGP